MKKLPLFLLIHLCLLLSLNLTAQNIPQGINYQCIIRDATTVVAEQPVTLRISIDNYVELHETSTNEYGLVNLVIGKGEPLPFSDDFNQIDWTINPIQLIIEYEADSGFKVIGESNLWSTPYSFHAQTAKTALDDNDTSPSNEIQVLSMNGNQINLSGGGGSVELPEGVGLPELQLNGTELSIINSNSIDLSTLQDGVEDADADPNNEIQTLSLNNGAISLSNGGGSIDLPSGSDTQNLTLDGTQLSIENGNTVNLNTLQDGVEDADADPNNEIQTLSLNNGAISLSNGGGSIDLPSGSDTQNLTLDGTQLSIENGNTVNLNILQDGVEDADADPNNEIQTLSLNNGAISLSNGGGSIDLPSGSDTQNLTLDGTQLSIENGNTVNLNTLQDGVEDADADPNNEIQTLSLNNGAISLSNGGGSIDLPSGSDTQNLTLDGTQLSIENGNTVNLNTLQDGVEDADADPSNEIQTLSLNNGTLNLSGGGGSVFIPSGGDDEQTLQLNGTQLSIENGNSVNLSALQDGVEDADADPNNERQTLSLNNGTLTLSGGGGSVFIPSGGDDEQTLQLNGTQLSIENGNSVNLSALQDGVEDDDADPANEIQSLVFDGENLSLTRGGNSVSLASLAGGSGGGNSDWNNTSCGNGKVLDSAGTPIGIGSCADNNVRLQITNEGSGSTRDIGLKVVAEGDNNQDIQGADIEASGTGNTNALQVRATGGSTSNDGVILLAANGNNNNVGMKVVAGSTQIPQFTTNQNFGLFVDVRDQQSNSSSSRLMPTTDVGLYVTSAETVQDYAVFLDGDLGIPHEVEYLNPNSGNQWATFIRKSGSNTDDLFVQFNSQSAFAFDNSSNGMFVTSDKSLKKNITPLQNILPRVKKLNPVSYHYKWAKEEEATVGFIAQEVQVLFEELVATIEIGAEGEAPEAKLGLNYPAFSVIAIKAIQEQQEIIDSQTKVIEAQQEKLEALSVEMEKIKAWIADQR